MAARSLSIPSGSFASCDVLAAASFFVPRFDSPPYLGHPWISGDAASAFDRCAELAAQIKATVRLARRYADAITENPFQRIFT
jgi:hypothetical protein